MNYLLAGLFDWIQFSTDRITHPAVITGIVLVVLGILSAVFANPIGNTAFAQSINQKLNKSEIFVAGVFRIGGYVLILVGCIVMACIK